MRVVHLATAIALLLGLCACSPAASGKASATVAATAAPGAIEVALIALNHPPLQPVLAQVDGYLWQYGAHLHVTRYDFETPEGAEFSEEMGLSGHLPLAIFVNGSCSFSLDGRSISLIGFPEEEASDMGVESTWSLVDLNAILKQATAGS